MKKIDSQKLVDFIERNAIIFNKRREIELKKFDFNCAILSQNPYLFALNNKATAGKIVTSLINSYLLPKEELLLDELLKKLAIFVCTATNKAKKFSIKGVDLEFEKDGKVYLLIIVSPNSLINSPQLNNIEKVFQNAKVILKRKTDKPIKTFLGYYFGSFTNDKKDLYETISGQSFWKLVSGSSKFYQDIIEPLKQSINKKNENLLNEYYRSINIFATQFSNEFCVNGVINWKKIVQLNSGKQKIKVNL